MAYLSILDNKTSMLCNWIVSYSQVTRLGLGLEFLVLFFMVRVRVRVRVIITWYVYVFYKKSHSFTSFSLCNLTVQPGYNVSL